MIRIYYTSTTFKFKYKDLYTRKWLTSILDYLCCHYSVFPVLNGHIPDVYRFVDLTIWVLIFDLKKSRYIKETIETKDIPLLTSPILWDIHYKSIQ